MLPVKADKNMSRMRRRRRLLDATIYEVAERAGTTPATVSRIETGDREGSPKMRAKIAHVLAEMTNEYLREGAVQRT